MGKGLRRALYACVAALAATGVWYAIPRYADLYFGRDWPALAPPGLLMKLHGAFALASLLVLGGIWQVHVRLRIRRAENRAPGLALLAAVAFLIVSGYLLYYAGSRDLREWSGLAHTAVGVALVAIIVWHVRGAGKVAARRARRIARAAQSAPPARMVAEEGLEPPTQGL